MMMMMMVDASAQSASLSLAAAAVEASGNGLDLLESGTEVATDMEDGGTGFSSPDQRCTCCPYGFHIDLDFLQFLDSLYNAENLKTLKRFKRRSNSALSPDQTAHIAGFPLNHEGTRETENIVLISEGDGVSTQEILDEISSSLYGTATSISRVISPTLHPKRVSPSRLGLAPQSVDEVFLENDSSVSEAVKQSDSSTNVREVSSPVKEAANASFSGEGIKRRTITTEDVDSSSRELISGSNKHLKITDSNLLVGGTIDTDGGSISPAVLHAIREQLASCLQRMKEMEEQLKIIPILQARIAMLKEENSLLVLSADRIFRDAAVGEYSVDDDDVGSSLGPAASRQASVPGVPGVSDLENDQLPRGLTSETFHKRIESSSTRNNISTISTTSRSVSALPYKPPDLKSDFRSVDIGVNTDVVSAAEATTETRSVGTIYKVEVRDISIGDRITLTDSCTGEGTIPYAEVRETTSEPGSLSYSERHLAAKIDNSSQVYRADEDFENRATSGLYEISGVHVSGRFRSVAVQCGAGDDLRQADGPAERSRSFAGTSSGNDKWTQTDDVLLSEYVANLLKTTNMEDLKSEVNEVQTSVARASLSTRKTVAFGEVTIYDARTPEEEEDEASFNDYVTVFKSEDDSVLHKNLERCEIESSTTGYSSSSPPGDVQKQSVDRGPVEGIVSEQVLESPRCGESVIIYDSNESSTTSSDSEEGSALSVLEVTPGTTTGYSIRKAVKSVDDYFDLESTISSTEERSVASKTSTTEVVSYEEVGIGEPTLSPSSHTVEINKDPTKTLSNALFQSLTKQTEAVGEAVVFSEAITRSVSTDSKVTNSKVTNSKVTNSKVTDIEVTDSRNLTCEPATENASSSSSISSESEVQSVTLETNAFAKQGHVEVSPGVTSSERGVAGDRLVVSDESSKFSSPVTDHIELVRVVKSHACKIADVALALPASNIPSQAVTRDVTPKSATGYDVTRASSSDVTSTSTSTRRVIITETRVERRRVDQRTSKEQPSLTSLTSICHATNVDLANEGLANEDLANKGLANSKSKELGISQGEVGGVDGEERNDYDREVALSQSRDVITDKGCVEDTEIPKERIFQDDKMEESVEQLSRSGGMVEGVLSNNIRKDAEAESSSRRESVEEHGSGGETSHRNIDQSETHAMKRSEFDGSLQDALVACQHWLNRPTGTDIDELSAVLDFVRKHWFTICGRKSSSVTEVKDFLTLSHGYSDLLLKTVVNMTDSDGNTALHYAISYSNADVIKHLLDTGVCDVSRQNKAGYTAVMLAALLLVDMGRHGNVIQRLFESGDVNVPSRLSGQTALMLAASHGRNDMMSLLLECGANVNAQDEDGSTALMCASEHGHIDIIKTLLSHADCDSTLTDVDGSTALSIAMDEGYQEIGVLLYAHMKAIQGSASEDDGGDDTDDLNQKDSPSS